MPFAQPDNELPGKSLLDLLRASASAHLDDIGEPSAEELAALDAEALDDSLDDSLFEATVDLPPSALSLLAELDEPELVSFEGLDDAKHTDAAALNDGQVGGDLLDDDENLLEDFVDIELDDAELADEGYDLDDEDDEEIANYYDLYGEDDAIVPSFREGEFVEDDDGDSAYFEELR
ncbi:MAG: hypothetical protein F4Z94_08735 [Chloroflexi bacterium]|nr:hypothetical protein [Chloroflexota bacterium]